MKLKLIVVILFAALIIVGAATLRVNAQTAGPELLITWSAQGSYAPSNYPDKVLPNQSSRITASLTLISGGRQVDLSGQTIYWYENGTLIDGGQGVQYIFFSPFGTAPTFLTLNAQVPSYGDNGSLLQNTVQIPIIQPKAVIEAQHPQENFLAKSFTLQATPYFFSVANPSSLSYAWSVNGQSPATAENPETFQVNIASGTSLGSAYAVSLTITDQASGMSAYDSTNLTYAE